MELTAAEIELIRIKREQDLLQEQQEALQSQLEYDSNLRKQSEQIETKRKQFERKYEVVSTLYNKLCTLGVKEYITKREYKQDIQAESYITRELKEGDITVEDISQISLITKWGNLDDINSSGDCYLPYSLSNRQQYYKPETVARKILETVVKENRVKLETEVQEIYFNNLVVELKSSSPVDTEFFKTTEYIRNQYNKHSEGYNQLQLKIEYPNKSWVILNVYQSSWNIKNKFDSKYIKPETNEEWLKYLAKE